MDVPPKYSIIFIYRFWSIPPWSFRHYSHSRTDDPQKKEMEFYIYIYPCTYIYIYNYLELFTIAHSNYKILQVSGFHKLDHQKSAEKKVHHLGPRLQRHHGFLLCKAPMLCAQQGQLQRLPNLWMVYYGKSQTKRDDLGIPHDKTDTSM